MFAQLKPTGDLYKLQSLLEGKRSSLQVQSLHQIETWMVHENVGGMAPTEP